MLKELHKKIGLKIEENVSLKNLTTLRLGGEARYFLVSHDVHELLAAVKAALELKINFFVLGGGSNVVISDAGFEGLVIKNESGEVSIEGNEAMVDSGIKLPVLIRKLAELDMGGLEFMAGKPGTLGGGGRKNAGG